MFRVMFRNSWYYGTVLSACLSVLGESAPSTTCVPETFSGLSLWNGATLDIATTTLTNYSQTADEDYSANHYPVNVTGVNVCELNITYTHPGQNDTITTIIWLPLQASAWNERMMGVGGGGWLTGFGRLASVWPAAQGYSAVSTDGGHSDMVDDPEAWALTSPGNVNWALFQDFASIALDDAATLGKAATAAYYGTPPKFSYWSGCSTGGRQGHMLAQRYPTQYDGIVASCSAMNWGDFLSGQYYPQLVMNLMDEYPPTCELDAITAAAVSACDDLDGVKDQVILTPSRCIFDPYSLVGQSFNCSGVNSTFTEAGAKVAEAVWTGSRSEDGKSHWFGLNKDAPLTALGGTTCTTPPTNGSDCIGSPFYVSEQFLRYYIARNASFDLTKLTHAEFDRFTHLSKQEYDSIIGTNDPDLSEFKAAGGKMITWHGLIDLGISPNGTLNYYERVRVLDPDVADYYRFFLAPGAGHCVSGPGWFPGSAIDAIVKWVEEGVAPDRLSAASVGTDGPARQVELCPYPLELKYIGGDTNAASSFTCV